MILQSTEAKSCAGQEQRGAASVDAEIIGHKQKKKLAIEQLDQLLRPDGVMSVLLALKARRD
jgi:hypothetical protein